MTPKQEDALLDYLQEVITPLIEQVLVKKLGQAMSFAKEELTQPKREWQDLTDKEVELIYANSQTTKLAISMAQSTLKEKNT